MKSFLKHIIGTLALILFTLTSYSQSRIKNIGSIPFINYYSTDDYNAARQNWDVVQDNRGIMYFANTNGSVLEFDGQNWNRIKVSDIAIRSLCVDSKNNIFVGGNNIFGVLVPDANGKLIFKSLNYLIPEKHKDFREVWDIFITKDSTIFFQTEDEIFLYNYDTIKTLSIDDYFSEGLFNISFKLNNEIYVYTKWKGLYKLFNNDLKFINQSTIIDSSFVRAILPYKNNENIIFTWMDGAFKFASDNSITHIDTPIDSIILHNSYRVIDIKNKYFGFLLGSGGLLITDKDFNIIQFLRSPDDLKNDKFYKTVTDNQNNLWLCSNNGIVSMYLFSPFSKFGKTYGFDNEATCLTSLYDNNNLIIGTNSNLFYKSWPNFENKLNIEKFKRIPNDAGYFKIQEIKKIQNDILIASEGGFFKLSNFKINHILRSRAVRVYKQTIDDPNTIIGISAALFIFKKDSSNNWYLAKDIQNYNGNFLEQDEFGNFWTSNMVDGITKITFNSDYLSIKKTEKYLNSDNSLNGLPNGSNIKIFKLFNKVVFTTSKGIYTYNNNTDSFVPYDEINNLLGDEKNISLIYEDSKRNIWIKKQIITQGKTNWELSLFLNTDSGYTVISRPFLALKNKIFSFYQISDNQYIIGGTSGFTHYDATMKFDSVQAFPVFIRSVKITNIDSTIFDGSFITTDSIISFKQLDNNIITLPNKYGNLRFTFAGAFYKNPSKIEYTYYLEGNDEKWSDWTTENYKDYSNLKANEYTFYVKARNLYNSESSIASYKFIIKPPFYLTLGAFIFYFVVGAFLIWFIVYLYTRRLRKQKEYLEFQVQQRTKEIAQQTVEIQAQRDQLANKNEEIEKINKDLTDSIEYAKRIQTAMLPLSETIDNHLEDYFILFKPRDIVSGDFYWFSEKNGKIFITAVDCTGHGVPGAFMSMIGAEILTTIINNREVDDAAEILDLLNKNVRIALKQDTTENQDGMDMALCVIDKKTKTLEFSGAKNPLLYIHDGEMTKIRGNKQSIGGYQFDSFKKEVITYQSPTYFYIFSDGYPDQFGGEENSKFMIKRFKDILMDIHEKPMKEQKIILDKKINEWMIGTRQTDDILVIGFKL